MAKYIATFVSLISCAIIAWASGYDFDHRDPWVGLMTAITAILALFVYAFPYSD